MDTNSFIIGLVLLFASIFPFLFMSLRSKSAALKTIKAFAAKENETIKTFEVLGDLCIAISTSGHTLYFYRKSSAEKAPIAVHLKAMATAKIEVKKNSQDKISEISWQFYPKNSELPLTSLLIYDGAKQMQLSGELQFIQQWHTKVQAQF